MRDILVTLLIFGSLPFIFKRPYIGVLVWSWISYMNPHRLTWSWAFDMPFAQIVASVLLLSLLFTKEPKKFPVDGLMFIWIAFLIWMTITTIFAINPEEALEFYIRMMKIQLVTFVTLMCMSDQKRIDKLIWVICVSIGFFSVKGGLFTLVSGGHFRVYGPPNSFIYENNALALATLMTVPLMYYLASITENKWLKLGLYGAMLLSVLSVLGSQSRGAVVAILALGVYFWFQSRSKLVSGVAVVLVAILGLMVMPQSWHDRVDSIQNYEEDESALSRIRAWKLCFNVANARVTGGGFRMFNLQTYARYSEPVSKGYIAHSIYFMVLGAHGWPGLLMYLSILFLTLKNLSRMTKLARGDPALKDVYVLSRMLTLSLITFMAGGSFLSLTYFDLPWHIIAIAYLLKHQSAARLGQSKNTEVLKDKVVKKRSQLNANGI